MLQFQSNFLRMVVVIYFQLKCHLNAHIMLNEQPASLTTVLGPKAKGEVLGNPTHGLNTEHSVS